MFPDKCSFIPNPEPALHDHEPVLEHEDVEKAQQITGVVHRQPVRQVRGRLVLGEEKS